MTTSRDELLRKWVEALESGTYQQTQYALRRGTSYCCLGVVCDLSDQGSWVDNPRVWHADDGSHLYLAVGSRDAQECGLPTTVSRFLAISPERERQLWEANDNGESFTQIAGRIRLMFPDLLLTVQP